MKVLVYVDGENVPYSEVALDMDANLNSIVDPRQMVRKVYGAQNVLCNVLQEYYNDGFIYVETSTLAKSSKNLCDMKITVDAIADVMAEYKEEDISVYIYSRDVDFAPLRQKLKSLGVIAQTPFYREGDMPQTLSDVTIAIRESEYKPLDSTDWMLPTYNCIRRVLDDKISDEVILRYVVNKKANFMNAIMGKGSKVLITKISEISARVFSLSNIFKVLPNIGDEDAIKLIDLYTRKFFGALFSRKAISVKLKELQEVVYEWEDQC